MEFCATFFPVGFCNDGELQHLANQSDSDLQPNDQRRNSCKSECGDLVVHWKVIRKITPPRLRELGEGRYCNDWTELCW